MEQKNIGKIQLSTTDKLIEVLSWLILLISWIYSILYFSKLPEIIPSHFNALGKVDDYANKMILFIAPAISSFLVVGLTYLNRFPHLFNFPFKINKENAEKSYQVASRMIRYLKFSIALIFLLILDQTIQLAITQNNNLGFWVLPLILAMVFIPITFFLKKLFRVK